MERLYFKYEYTAAAVVSVSIFGIDTYFVAQSTIKISKGNAQSLRE